MNWLPPKVSSILEVALCAGIIGWVLWRWLKKSDDPPRLISKWIISGVMVGLTWWIAGRKIGGSAGGLDYGAAFIVAIACAACGVVLGITWGSNMPSRDTRSPTIIEPIAKGLRRGRYARG